MERRRRPVPAWELRLCVMIGIAIVGRTFTSDNLTFWAAVFGIIPASLFVLLGIVIVERWSCYEDRIAAVEARLKLVECTDDVEARHVEARLKHLEAPDE